MNRKLFILFIASLLMIAGGCASKKYAKKGLKFEQAGLWQQATDAYFHSLMAKRDNIDAIIGLKRAGQRVLDEQSLEVIQAYENDDLKGTVYKYIDAEDLKNRASAFGIELSISNIATDYFNDAKPKYIQNIYSEAQRYMDEERFKEAEQLLSEIKKLQPDYGNVQDMLKVSKCEPLYREAKEFMNASLYRKAYYNLDKIIREYNSYKDARELRDEVLEKATITIQINDFTTGTRNAENITKSVQTEVASSLNKLKNPFIKVIDTKNTDKIIEEQQRSLTIGSDFEIGKLLSAKAILNGELTILELSPGKLNKIQKRGYLREETKVKDPNTGEIKTKVSYKKVYYYEYSQKNNITIALKYQLTSTETGEILVTDYVRSNQSDYIEYATFDGSKDKLVPGYWEKIDVKTEKDVINDNTPDVRRLQEKLNARREITSIASLMSKAINEVGVSVANKIGSYNPED
ncbi:MAG: hypothetical protein PWR03_1304 [Tenuifilum sp.]|uniref:tetratricopeptide repeat protein n=1 Tax=Tenuifilum sp. TaxID=2760880 RepID=UPI0024AC479E|nr:hypothetical protein [Tenuifilum sp.]MDI3527121.1 hypothetical protein [Tenuifilum sp.]